jgi:branched-chain amino acid transport system substrate-binding protein
MGEAQHQMKRKHLVRVAAVALGLALVAAACGGDDSDNADTGGGGGDAKEYAIAYVGPLTGDAANLGVLIRDGAKVAVEQFNESHDDIHITLKEFDTQGDAAIAPSQFDKYVADDSIIGIVGPAFSGETKAVLPQLEENGLVMVSASATNVGLPDVVPNSKIFHRVLPDDNAQAAGIVKYLETTLKPESIAIIHDNTEYGKGLAVDQLAAQLPDSIKVATTQAIDPKGQDYSAAVNAVKSSGAKAVFYGGYYEAAGRLKKQLTDGGVTAQFISADGALDPGFIKAAGDAADGSILTCPCSFATEDAGGKVGEFAKAYKEIIGSDPGTYSAEAFDAANILMEGIAAGHTTRPELLEYVEGLTSVPDAISKTVAFAPNGNIEAQGIFLYKVQDGKIRFDLATDDL